MFNWLFGDIQGSDLVAKTKKKPVFVARPWVDSLYYDPITKDFRYATRNIVTGVEVLVLEGNGRDHNQDERNRARKFVYRLTDVLNVCCS